MNVRFALVTTVFTVVAFYLNLCFLDLLEWDSGLHQSNFLYDAYYYWMKGGQYKEIYGASFQLHELSSIAPTKNSVGIVYIDTLLQYIGIDIIYIPIIMGLIYYITVRSNFSNVDNSIVLVFASLLPINFLLSKESLLYLGLIFAVGWMLDKNKWRILVSIILIAFARYEVIIIIAVSIIISKCIKYRWPYLLTISIIFWIALHETSVKYEQFMAEAGTLVFNGAVPITMITSDYSDLLIIISRIFFTVMLPLKWLLLSPIEFFSTDDLKLKISALTSFFTIFYILIAKVRIPKILNSRAEIIITTFLVYILLYSIVLFHQPTRQMLFSISAFVFLYRSYTINCDKNKI